MWDPRVARRWRFGRDPRTPSYTNPPLTLCSRSRRDGGPGQSVPPYCVNLTDRWETNILQVSLYMIDRCIRYNNYFNITSMSFGEFRLKYWKHNMLLKLLVTDNNHLMVLCRLEFYYMCLFFYYRRSRGRQRHTDSTRTRIAQRWRNKKGHRRVSHTYTTHSILFYILLTPYCSIHYSLHIVLYTTHSILFYILLTPYCSIHYCSAGMGIFFRSCPHNSV